MRRIKRPPCCIDCVKGALHLEGNYSVYFGKERVGTVQVYRRGLYWQFVCRCRLYSKSLCRLQVTCCGQQVDLGILVPVQDDFGLEKKLPVKRLGEGTPEFRIRMAGEKPEKQFIPICPEEPFAYISRLKESYLVHRNGALGIEIA